jgi:hypothetical protein
MGKTKGPENRGDEDELSEQRESLLMQGGKRKKKKPVEKFSDFFTQEQQAEALPEPSQEQLLANPEPLLDLPSAEEIKAEELLPVPQTEKTETKKLPPVSPNSRLYRQFVPLYKQNRHEEQLNYRDLDEYLNHMMSGIVTGEESLPVGCKNPSDLLKPYWETEQIAGIPASSMFALEHGLEFQQNKQLQEKYHGKFERYLQTILNPLLSAPADVPNVVGLPEEAKNLQDAIRPLDEAEVKTWFNGRKRDLEKHYKEQGLRNFKKLAYETYLHLGYDGYKKQFFPDQAPETLPVAIADPDSQAHFGLDEPRDNDYFAFNNRKTEKKSAHISQTKKVEKVTKSLLGKASESVEPSQEFLDEFYGSAENKFEVVAGEVLPIRNAKFELRGNQLTMEFDRRQEKDGVFEYLPGGRVHVNLPPDVAANYASCQKEAEDTLKALVIENKGKWKPGITNKIGDLSFGIGDDTKMREIFKMPPLLLRQLSSELYKRYSWYIDLKTKPKKKLDRETERLPMYAYEDQLRNLPVKSSVTGRETTLLQYVWDNAFNKDLEAKLGAERLEELKKQVLNSVPKSNSTTPDSQSTQKPASVNAEKFKELPKADEAGFIKEFGAEFGIGFLQSDVMYEAVKKYHLKYPDAFLAIARKGLSPEQCQKFEGLLGLTERQIVDGFFQGDPFYNNRHKKGLLHRALIRLFRENLPAPRPAPSPTAAKQQRLGSRTTTPQQEQPASFPPGFKFRKEPKTEGNVEDHQVWPEAEYYPAFQTIQGIMDKYGRLDVEALKQQTNLDEHSLQLILERALAAMGFLKDYRAGLIDYKNSPDYQEKLVQRVRKLQNEWLGNGRQMGEAEAFMEVQREMEFELLTKAVESFYHIRPETLKFEAEKLKVPPSFEEVKYISQPKCVIMRDKVSGFEYFGIPGPQGTWDKVPLPDNINIDDPAQIEEMYNVFSDMTKDNDAWPIIQLKDADGENFRDGHFEIYIDRHLVKSVPVRDFINRDLVRGDVKDADRNNEIYKELLIKSFQKLQHNQAGNFAQRDRRAEALEDLLLNTPLRDNVSFGDEALFLALKRRLAAVRAQRVQGSLR